MKIEIPEVKKLLYEMRFPVRWGDMDAMGHVNNTVYFRYLENARIAWMEAIGCHPDPRGEAALGQSALVAQILDPQPVLHPYRGHAPMFRHGRMASASF